MRKKFVYCYNKYLLKYLLDKGFEFLSIGTNHNTNTEYHLFERTDALTQAMDAYELTKQAKQS